MIYEVMRFISYRYTCNLNPLGLNRILVVRSIHSNSFNDSENLNSKKNRHVTFIIFPIIGIP